MIVDKFTQKNLLEFKKFSNQMKLFTIQETEELGKETPTIDDYERPTLKDLAVVMYTSGSTGTIFMIIYTYISFINHQSTFS